ncbi:MAG: glutamate/gamma-aminobutyrate family transporter YjeM, partial [Sarcina sp.]
IGTFMWYASYVIWMVNVSSGIWIPFSNTFFGKDVTQSWTLPLGFTTLNSTQILGILGILWILLVTFVASHGLEKISKVTSIGGTAVALLNVVLIVGAIIVLVGNKGQFLQDLNSQAFVNSPHPDYKSTIGMLSFLVFAIFAFGGIEVVGGLVDETENAEKNFPKGLAISAIVISIGYAIGIFLCGVFTNWQQVLSSDKVHMANVAYVMMQNLGLQIGLAVGLSQAASFTLGLWIARFTGLSMFLALTGAFFTLTYAPLKQLIEGTPKKLWPGRISEIKDGMPKFAMKLQAGIVIVIIAIVSLPPGSGASEFFTMLVLMTNVSMTIPYLFLSIAFISFKRKKEIIKPFEVYKNQTVATVAAVIVTITVGFANVFTI